MIHDPKTSICSEGAVLASPVFHKPTVKQASSIPVSYNKD